jgi:organic radical activating enzyme
MRLTSTRSPGVFWVDWWLMNHCSWQCSYCADIIRNKTIALPALRDCEKFVDDVSEFAGRQGRRLNVSFTGGEITEWPQLADLLAHCRSRAATVSIRSNGHCHNDLWEAVCQSADHINLLFHPEHSQTVKFLRAITIAVERGCGLTVTLNMLPERFQEILEMEQIISNRWPGVAIDRRMLFEDPTRNTRPQQYTEEQQEQLENQWGDILLEQGEQKIYTDFQTLVIKGQNGFKDSQCWAGIEQLVVDAWGKVFRGHCRQWGSLGHIGGEIRWPREAMICMKDQCANGFDILARKEST